MKNQSENLLRFLGIQILEYIEPFLSNASLSMPFLKERVSDESTYATNALEIFSLLGKLCKESSDGIRYEIATALSAFYEGKTNEELKIPVGE